MGRIPPALWLKVRLRWTLTPRESTRLTNFFRLFGAIPTFAGQSRHTLSKKGLHQYIIFV